MNPAKKGSAKIRKYELAYRSWLKKVFKLFGKYSLSETLISLTKDTNLSPEIVDTFMKTINLEPINYTFEKILEQNIKFFESLIQDNIKSRSIPNGSIEKLIEKTLPQRAIYNSFSQDEILRKRKDFFVLQKNVIESEVINTYTKRKNQLSEFRQSYLFNSPDNLEKFKEKYPEPTYKFSDSMGRTQINNLNRDLSATLATNMGAKKCEWLTSNDERVRKTHRELAGKIFSYDNLPAEYNDYNCRCELLPVLGSISGVF